MNAPAMLSAVAYGLLAYLPVAYGCIWLFYRSSTLVRHTAQAFSVLVGIAAAALCYLAITQ